VVHPKTVHTHSVDASHIALVFHGTRREERSPRIFAGLRPVCYDEQRVVVRFAFGIERIAQPDREAQIKADRQSKAPSAPGDND
jgi:hypothetical protein